MKIKCCSLCGFDPNLDIIDCFYPINRSKKFFHLFCATHIGGCGRETWGRNEKETIDRWNLGIVDFTDKDSSSVDKFLDILNKEKLNKSFEKF